MSEFDIKRAFSVCITGHRAVEKDITKEYVEKYLKSLVERDFTTFYVGMALGFDTLCFKILEKIREQKKIKIVACIPCPSQPERFSFSQKKEYFRMIESADEKVILSQEYTPYCMQKRNQYMVDNSGVVLAYLRKSSGGTYNTVRYANQKGVPVIKI